METPVFGLVNPYNPWVQAFPVGFGDRKRSN